MNSDAFIDICEKSFSESKVRLGPMQKTIYVEKLRRFSEHELDKIFEHVIEGTKYFPKIADIYAAARECGFLQTESDKFRPHHWRETDCGLCRGEGRVAIIWHCFYEARDTGMLEIQELTQALPYAASFDYRFKPNEYRSIFRCRCRAGEAATLPQAWPKFSNTTETRRERWA